MVAVHALHFVYDVVVPLVVKFALRESFLVAGDHPHCDHGQACVGEERDLALVAGVEQEFLLFHGVFPGGVGYQDVDPLQPLRISVCEFLDGLQKYPVRGVLLIGHDDVEVGGREHP
eukprot:6978008-Heterocapsa_arctica.AAC.1